MIRHEDEVLDRAIASDNTPVARYNILGSDGNVLYENVSLELANPILREGTPINKALLDEFLSASGETEGDGAAYTLAQPGYVLADGAVVRIRAHEESASEPTLNISGTGVKPLVNAQGLPVQKLIGGVWYTAVFSSLLDAYVVQGVGGNVATGTYVGTGISGESNPNVLAFDFEPSFIFIAAGTFGSSFNNEHRIAWLVKSGTLGMSVRPENNYYESAQLKAAFTGSTVSWYVYASTTESAAKQMNSNGITYQWLAIG